MFDAESRFPDASQTLTHGTHGSAGLESRRSTRALPGESGLVDRGHARE
jgi:hypothetical protein